jgi:hypothetical protein
MLLGDEGVDACRLGVEVVRDGALDVEFWTRDRKASELFPWKIKLSWRHELRASANLGQVERGVQQIAKKT